LKYQSTISQQEAYSGAVRRLVHQVFKFLGLRDAGDREQKHDYRKK
jgi:hypothetical protein